jgi:beta-lactamase regulating signal transducer with metallopeptidase domain
MTIELWMNPAVIQRMAGSLLHFFWLGALLALFASISLRLLARRTAAVRYIVCVAALVLMLLAPILTFMFYAETGHLTLRVIRLIGESLTASRPKSFRTADTAEWAQWIVLIWTGGVLACALRLAASWKLSQRLRRSALDAVPAPIAETFERVRETLLRGKQVALRVSGISDTPLVVGWLRPVVLLPLSAVTGLSQEQLIAVFAHELAHVRRHDFFVNVLQSCVECVLFYHPAVWWLSVRVRTERENCCDDLAVQVCGDRLMYARALIELEQARSAAPVLAVAATGTGLTMRIRRILGNTTTSRDWQSAVASLAFMLVWIMAGVWQSSTLKASSMATRETMPAAIVLPASLSTTTIVGAVQSIAAIVTAQPIAEEPHQSPTTAVPGTESAKGSIQGTVTKAGTSEVIPNVQITLSPASIGDSIRALPSLMASRSISMTAPKPDAVVDPRSVQSLVTVAGSQGIALSRENAEAALNSLIGNNTLTAITDGAGHFTIAEVPSGEYIVSARRDGFFGQPVNATSPLLMTPVLATTTAKVIEKKTADVVISMIPAGVVSGKIRDAAGSPLSKISVRALALNYQNGYPVVQAAASVKTDDNGDYRLFWLPPGNYYVGADPPASGNEVAATGGAAVTAKMYYPGVSDLANALPLTVNNGAEISGIQIDMKPAANSLKISGQITNNVPPPPQPANGGPRRAATPVFIILKHEISVPEDIDARYAGVVPASGQFEFKNLVPGVYDLYARIDDNQVLPPYGWGRATVNMQNQDIANIAITVPQSMSVPGSIAMSGGTAASSLSVQVAFRVDGSAARIPAYQSVRMATIMADGTFQLTGIPPGHYHAELFPALSSNLYVSNILRGGIGVFDSGFDVEPDTLDAIQIVLSTGSGTASGTVRDRDRKPIAGATVVLVPPIERRQNPVLYRTAVSDSTGRFTVKGIAPGNYKLFAWESVPASAYRNSEFMMRYEERGVAVNVLPSSSLDMDLTAIPAN